MEKNLPASTEDSGAVGLIPGEEKSPGERNSNPLQYSCLGNSMDRGVLWATSHGVARIGHNLVTKPPSVNISRGS